MARAALRYDLYAEQAALTAAVLQAGVSPRECVETWLAGGAREGTSCAILGRPSRLSV